MFWNEYDEFELEYGFDMSMYKNVCRFPFFKNMAKEICRIAKDEDVMKAYRYSLVIIEGICLDILERKYQVEPSDVGFVKYSIAFEKLGVDKINNILVSMMGCLSLVFDYTEMDLGVIENLLFYIDSLLHVVSCDYPDLLNGLEDNVARITSGWYELQV